MEKVDEINDSENTVTEKSQSKTQEGIEPEEKEVEDEVIKIEEEVEEVVDEGVYLNDQKEKLKKILDIIQELYGYIKIMMSKVDLISNNPLINQYNRKLKLQDYLKTFIKTFKEKVINLQFKP